MKISFRNKDDKDDSTQTKTKEIIYSIPTQIKTIEGNSSDSNVIKVGS